MPNNQANNDSFKLTLWLGFALVLLVVPWVFTSNLSMTMLSQMGIAIIACLSYNLLLGQGGMLSFGHAVYSGMGSYLTIHALNAVSQGNLHLPVTLLPLIGGLAGMAFAVLLGFVTTRKSGTAFSMITLGMAELVFAMSLMFSEFFGGEAGGVRQPGGRRSLPGHQLRPAAAGVLPDSGLHLCLRGAALRPDTNPFGSYLERGARQPGSRGVHWLQHPTSAL